MMPTIDETLNRLGKSTFRVKFHLTDKQQEKIVNLIMAWIEREIN